MKNKESKYIRTMTKLGCGAYVSARIDKRTGEVRPYEFKHRQRPVKPTKKVECVDYEPFWMSGACVAESPTRGADVQPSKTAINPYFGMLDKYDVYEIRSGGVGQAVSADGELDEDEIEDAICSLADNLPFMDNYFTGVANLGTHNPLSKNVLFHLLRSLPEINSKTIYEATHYSLSYCQRLATALRIFIKLTT